MEADRRTYLPDGTPTQSYSVIAPFSNVMTESGIGTQALLGQRFELTSEKSGVAQGALYSVLHGINRVDYIGHLPVTELAEGLSIPTHIVTAVSATVFESADIKSRLVGSLPRNSAIHGDVEGDFLNYEHSGYIHLRHLRKFGDASQRSFISFATDMLGLPYVWGGTGGIGVDCSGLVQSALAATGIDVPRDADQQEAALGQSVAYEDRRAGDIVFWPGHVGIVTQEDQLLHANAYHMCVALEPVTKAVARIGAVRTTKRL